MEEVLARQWACPDPDAPGDHRALERRKRGQRFGCALKRRIQQGRGARQLRLQIIKHQLWAPMPDRIAKLALLRHPVGHNVGFQCWHFLSSDHVLRAGDELRPGQTGQSRLRTLIGHYRQHSTERGNDSSQVRAVSSTTGPTPFQ